MRVCVCVCVCVCVSVILNTAESVGFIQDFLIQPVIARRGEWIEGGGEGSDRGSGLEYRAFAAMSWTEPELRWCSQTN